MKRIVTTFNIAIIVMLVGCGKPLTNGYQVVKERRGNYVKFYNLNRWYFIDKANNIKKNDTLFMKIKKPA